jgi:flagellar biosynthesis GTPase FlhF
MIQVIQGKTVQDAIKEATKRYGDDCEIIETRKKKGGLLKADSYEVVIKVPDQNQEAWSEVSRGLSRFEKNFGTKKNTNIDLSLENSINEYDDILDFKFGKEKTNLITDRSEKQQRTSQSSHP